MRRDDGGAAGGMGGGGVTEDGDDGGGECGEVDRLRDAWEWLAGDVDGVADVGLLDNSNDN